MTVNEYFQRIRTLVRDIRKNSTVQTDGDILNYFTRLAQERHYPIDELFSTLLYTCVYHGVHHPNSGICLPIAMAGKQLLGNAVRRADWYMVADRNYPDDSYWRPEFIHAMLEKEGVYYDVFFPDGVRDLTTHPLWQTHEELFLEVFYEGDHKCKMTDTAFSGETTMVWLMEALHDHL